MRVLAADIGGTKTLLQLAEFEQHRYEIIDERRYTSLDYADPIEIIRGFLEGRPQVEAACFGVAGPVHGDGEHQWARITNLPWHLHTGHLAQRLNVPRLQLINDFQAVGYSVELLQESDLMTLQEGREQPGGVRAVIGAGTGLGEGYLVWTGDHYEVMGSEGGHVDFAPQDDVQAELLAFLRQRHPHVSYERVLSGPGLVNIYSFLRHRDPAAESPQLALALAEGHPAAAISQFALKAGDPLARQALAMFVRIYGAQAGNLALTLLARGGVYIAGGIAPKIIEFLRSEHFLLAFNDKGRMEEITRAIPVRVIVNPRAGLIGAAAAGARLAQRTT